MEPEMMNFADTRPAELDAMPESHLDTFRVTGLPQIRSLLKTVMDRNIPVIINGSDGSAHTTQLWALDSNRDKIAFSADVLSPSLHRLIEAEEAVAVCYLEQIKLQFDVHERMLVHGTQSCVMQAAMPHELFRFQRRNAYRVRTLERSAPTAAFRHPAMPDVHLELRVLDLSAGGCALYMPNDMPPVEPGCLINGITVELDADTEIKASLLIHHITSVQPQAQGVRLGCELLNMDAESQRLLVYYIDQIQKRRRMMSLD
ncbi:MAG: flagellar brake protein [Ideonella sp. MAG2]|nr:MAG: flagellar brake protein [Ideonella sp. MAG2]